MERDGFTFLGAFKEKNRSGPKVVQFDPLMAVGREDQWAQVEPVLFGGDALDDPGSVSCRKLTRWERACETNSL